MVAKKFRHLLNSAHFLRVFTSLCLAFFCVSASAVLVFDNHRPALSSIIGVIGPLDTYALTDTWLLTSFPTGGSNPVLARNLQRAHRWSQEHDTAILYWSPTHATSLQSNMARARVFRNQ